MKISGSKFAESKWEFLEVRVEHMVGEAHDTKSTASRQL
jgi:hypothetical protein